MCVHKNSGPTVVCGVGMLIVDWLKVYNAQRRCTRDISIISEIVGEERVLSLFLGECGNALYSIYTLNHSIYA